MHPDIKGSSSSLAFIQTVRVFFDSWSVNDFNRQSKHETNSRFGDYVTYSIPASVHRGVTNCIFRGTFWRLLTSKAQKKITWRLHHSVLLFVACILPKQTIFCELRAKSLEIKSGRFCMKKINAIKI